VSQISYFSLGTFEFLVNPITKEYYFLEVNPRLQVEHTITESIASTDIVKAQLLLSQGYNLFNCGLPPAVSQRDPEHPPAAHSIQLRITAENVQSDWSLSIGKITSFQFPNGNGIRVDTHLINGHASVVSADFDSLIAKLIITASSWEYAVRKAQRALADTQISGVKTNLDILRSIVAHPDFMAGKCDTQWLESHQRELLAAGLQISEQTTNRLAALGIETASSTTAPALANANTMFRKGDAWSLTLDSPAKNTKGSTVKQPPHHLEITRVLRNEFPISISADILFTSPATGTSSAPHSTPYTITLTSTTSSASAATSHHRRGNPSDPSHICIPFPGKLVEVLVDEGDAVKEGDVICVVQQMKMELEVRSPRSGRVAWVLEVDEGEEVSEGMLAAIVEGEREARL
jgi:pyruvate carboxylase